jgi:hypothetical protein
MTATEPTAIPTLILDALLGSAEGLTLAALTAATGLPCGVLRAALDGLAPVSVVSTLEAPDGAERVTVDGEDIGSRAELPAAFRKCVRVYRATDTARCAREAVLAVLAEQGSEEALREASRETLRAAAHAFGATFTTKTTRAGLVDAILAHRTTLGIGVLCARCGEEPVDSAGEVCTVCEEAEQAEPKAKVRQPKAERTEGDLRIRVRRPDVALAFDDAERAAVEAIVRAAPTQWAAHNNAADWLASRSLERFCDSEVLRTILRTHGVLNKPNFTLYASKRGWARVERDGALVGWTVPKLDIKVSAKAAERGA